MSFLSDLFEGHTSNLMTDITHAPQSFVNDISSPSEWGPLAAAAAIALPFAAPELAGAAGFAGLSDLFAGGAGAADAAAGAADLTAADAAFSAFDPALFAANTADVAAGGAGVDLASLAADAPAIDIAGAGGGLTPFTDPTAAISSDVSAPTEAALNAPDVATPADAAAVNPSDVAAAAPTPPTSVPSVAAPSATPGGFAPTDAELTGGITGAGGPTAGGGGGISSFLSGITPAQWGKFALGATPLALTLAMGEPNLPGAATSLQSQAQALQQQGLQQLQQANAGILQPSQLSQVQQLQQNLTNQWLQTLANQGVTNPRADSRWPQIQAAIQQQVLTATSQLLQQNITNALAETGSASQSLTAIANMQMTADTNFTNNLVRAAAALGGAVGGGTSLKLVTA